MYYWPDIRNFFDKDRLLYKENKQVRACSYGESYVGYQEIVSTSLQARSRLVMKEYMRNYIVFIWDEMVSFVDKHNNPV